MKPVCLVIGAGAGIGGSVGKRFAREGHHAVLCRRSDAEGLRHLVESIEQEGGSTSGFLLDAALPDSIEQRVSAVESTASAVCPHMEQRGKGTILVTSATAAVRGDLGQHSHAGRHGRPAHAVSDPQCRVRTQGHPRRPHPHRRHGRCPRHARKDARARTLPAAAGGPRH